MRITADEKELDLMDNIFKIAEKSLTFSLPNVKYLYSDTIIVSIINQYHIV